MKTCYADYDTRAIADLTPIDKYKSYINRINVPKAHRGKGIGSKLLKQIIDDADRFGVTLVLDAAPSDGLDFEQLTGWYKRYGFEQAGHPENLIRRPVSTYG